MNPFALQALATCPEAFAGGARVVRRPGGKMDWRLAHLDAIDRTGRHAQIAAGASFGND
jgi:hypothetical protein